MELNNYLSVIHCKFSYLMPYNFGIIPVILVSIVIDVNVLKPQLQKLVVPATGEYKELPDCIKSFRYKPVPAWLPFDALYETNIIILYLDISTVKFPAPSASNSLLNTLCKLLLCV